MDEVGLIQEEEAVEALFGRVLEGGHDGGVNGIGDSCPERRKRVAKTEDFNLSHRVLPEFGSRRAGMEPEKA